MANLRNIVTYIFLFWFGIKNCYSVISLLLVKIRVKSFGKKIEILPNLSSSNRTLFNFTMFMFFFGLFFLIISKDIIFLIVCLWSINMVLDILLLRFLSRNNGIYENGIILGCFIKYKRIHSYKLINDREILLVLKSGRTINIKLNEENNSVIDLLEQNMIQSEQ
ncbi:MAG: hypothetical protein J6X67_12150 [Treponema sp.]|nr:hypothetical protein [Treponema sp.]